MDGRRNWLCLAFSAAVGLSALCGRRWLPQELASFRTLCPTVGTGSLAGPGPLLPVRELALFFQGRVRGRFVITLFSTSTCHSFRSGGNCFVSHVQSHRRHRQPCRPWLTAARAGKGAHPALPYLTRSNNGTEPARRKEKRRFRVRECWASPHREPLRRTRRSVRA
jgi:hypothetical protein